MEMVKIQCHIVKNTLLQTALLAICARGYFNWKSLYERLLNEVILSFNIIFVVLFNLQVHTTTS